MIAIVRVGIVMAMASSTWFGVVESRDIDSAADMLLAHGNAANRLGMARIIFDNDNLATNDQVTCNGVQADYCLVQPTTSGAPRVKPRFPPDRARISSSDISVNPVGVALATGVAAGTNLIDPEFGAAGASGAIIGIPTIRIAADNHPGHDVTFNTATSRVRVD